LQFVIFDQNKSSRVCNLSFLTKQIITPASQYSKSKVVKLIRVKRIDGNRKAVMGGGGHGQPLPKTINYPETITTWLQACFTKLAFRGGDMFSKSLTLCLA
jgi:hypothetical protein